jgi:hypothetical protein
MSHRHDRAAADLALNESAPLKIGCGFWPDHGECGARSAAPALLPMLPCIITRLGFTETLTPSDCTRLPRA